MPNAYGNQARNVPRAQGTDTGVKQGMQLGQRVNTQFGVGVIVDIIHPRQIVNVLNYNANEPFVLTVLLDGSRIPVKLYLSDFTFQSSVGGQLSAQSQQNNNL